MNKAVFIQLSEGDVTAFQIIFDCYKKPFYVAAFKITRSEYLAEEIVQEVFILLWTKRIQISAADQPENYLYTILYNCIFNQFKKIVAEKKMVKVVSNNLLQWEEHDMESIMQEKRNKELLHSVINQLPPQQKKVYQLSKEQGFSRLEIANQMKISPNSVKNHLHEAVKSILFYFRRNRLFMALCCLSQYLEN